MKNFLLLWNAAPFATLSYWDAVRRARARPCRAPLSLCCMSIPFQTFDEREFDAIVEKYFPVLTFFARRWAPDAAEDVAQNAFLKLVRFASKNGKPTNVSAWLFQTAKRAAIDESRKILRFRKFRRKREAREQYFFDESPETRALAREMTERLQILSESARQIVLLRIWGGLSFEEIADIVELPKTSVFREYQRALEELRGRDSNEGI